jgi:serine protease Do
VNSICHEIRSLLLASAVLLVCGVVRADSSAATITTVDQRIVKIFGSGGLKGLYGYSSGFLVSAEGHIVTVWSHVLDERTVKVILHDGRRFEALVVGAEPALDLAVLKIDGEDFPHFKLDDSVAAAPGTRVWAFSNMFKVAAGDEPVSVLHGVIAARTNLTARRGVFETPYSGPVYVIDAITNNPGAGGGVVTTRTGDLVAMIGKELRNAQSNTWINYAIPISEIRTAVGEIITGKFTPKTTRPSDDGQPARPRNYTAFDFGLVLVPDVIVRTPAFVDSLLDDSAAAQAGIKSNDLVLFVNDELIQSCRAFDEALGKLEAGDRLKLVLRRGNGLITVELPVPKKKP